VVKVDLKATFGTINKRSNMCMSGAMYVDEDIYDEEKEFYNKNSEEWDYYSGLPNPKFYESNDKT